MSVAPSLITCNLCEFIGAIIGNGNLWTDMSRYRVELTGDPKSDTEYFQHLSDLSYNLFNKRPYAPRVHARGLRWRLQSKDAFGTLQRLGIPTGGSKSLKVTIPEVIIEKGWNYSKWTIRGIMDTDGTLFFRKKTYKEPIYPTIEIRTSNKLLAVQITQLLQQHNFRARLRGDHNEGYHVALYGDKMLNLWIKEIGFSNTKHLKKITNRKAFRKL